MGSMNRSFDSPLCPSPVFSSGTSPSGVSPRKLRPLVLAALLLCAAAASAQSSSAKRPIEQQMTPAQFRAAGLDRLDAPQLANLNAWLNGAIETETAKATLIAKKEVEDTSRGFFNFGSSEPIVAKISGDFRGFASGRSYTLDNGHVWQQTDAASLAGVRLSSPHVKITPSLVGNAWYLQVQDYNKRAKVQRVK